MKKLIQSSFLGILLVISSGTASLEVVGQVDWNGLFVSPKPPMSFYPNNCYLCAVKTDFSPTMRDTIIALNDSMKYDPTYYSIFYERMVLSEGLKCSKNRADSIRLKDFEIEWDTIWVTYMTKAASSRFQKFFFKSYEYYHLPEVCQSTENIENDVFLWCLLTEKSEYIYRPYISIKNDNLPIGVKAGGKLEKKEVWLLEPTYHNIPYYKTDGGNHEGRMQYRRDLRGLPDSIHQALTHAYTDWVSVDCLKDSIGNFIPTISIALYHKGYLKRKPYVVMDSYLIEAILAFMEDNNWESRAINEEFLQLLNPKQYIIQDNKKLQQYREVIRY